MVVKCGSGWCSVGFISWIQFMDLVTVDFVNSQSDELGLPWGEFS